MWIRLAVPEDVAAVMELLDRVVPQMQAAGNRQWDESYPNAAVFRQDIQRSQLWVAQIEGSIAGMAALTTDQSPEYGHVGWDLDEPAIVVHRLAIDPEFRGAGIATALMQKAEEIAAERGISVVRVDTSMQNEAMQKLLLKLAYKLAGEIGLSFRPGLRVLCYEKRLI